MHAGVNIGDEAHHTHVSVLAIHGGWLVPSCERSPDGVDYDTQARIINRLAKRFKIDRIYYDATRGRWLSKMLTGSLPTGAEPSTSQRGEETPEMV